MVELGSTEEIVTSDEEIMYNTKRIYDKDKEIYVDVAILMSIISIVLYLSVLSLQVHQVILIFSSAVFCLFQFFFSKSPLGNYLRQTTKQSKMSRNLMEKIVFSIFLKLFQTLSSVITL